MKWGWTETAFLVIALCANKITSLIASLRSKRSFRGGAFLMWSRIRSMIAPVDRHRPRYSRALPYLAQEASNGVFIRK